MWKLNLTSSRRSVVRLASTASSNSARILSNACRNPSLVFPLTSQASFLFFRRPRPQRFGCALSIGADARAIHHGRLAARDHLPSIDEDMLDIAAAAVMHQRTERIEQRGEMRSAKIEDDAAREIIWRETPQSVAAPEHARAGRRRHREGIGRLPLVRNGAELDARDRERPAHRFR